MFFDMKKVKSSNIPLLRYSNCYAKTYQLNSDEKSLGYSVLEHSLIVASIARELIVQIEKNTSFIFPKFSELGALLHDVGKISPTFQKKLQPSIDGFESVDTSLEKEWGGHSGVSGATTKAIKECDEIINYIVSRHHERICPSSFTAINENFGGEAWQNERIAFIHDIINKFYKIDSFPKTHFCENIANYLLGLTIVSDWIGSGKDFEIPSKNWQKDIAKAIRHIGFSREKLLNNLSFHDIFSFNPHRVQEEFYSSVKGPGLYILEAPMGLGKTEAALYAAYKMISQSKASGIYFALPTQLTSEKIHERMGFFLEKIIPNNKQFENMLLHSKAWLKSFGINALHEDESIDYSWFASKKRALLAPFGVGTIDQALMSVINVKHASVRTFGLAGKVVILDEVHSYDMFTGTLINELVQSLLSLGCTVIVLSATLTKERRTSLFPKEVQEAIENEELSSSYPLISAYVKESNSFSEVDLAAAINLKKEVEICLTSEDAVALNKALESAEKGSQVLWIENTVDDAQNKYKEIIALSQGLDIEIGLLHSRFTQVDRSIIEDKWIQLYGKNSIKREEKGRILIGTQVLEQSIDIDADILFARFCPTDMLLQRLGRLHRHTETKRPVHVKCEAYILAPSDSDLERSFIEAFKKSQFIYSPYVLFRSLEVWKDITKVSLPDSIRPLLESTYMEREEEKLSPLKHNLKVKKEELQTHALSSLTMLTKPITDDTAQTRISDVEQKEILLLKKVATKNDELTVLPYSGEECTLSKNISHEKSKEISVELMGSTVKVPSYTFQEQKTKSFSILSNIAGGISGCALVGDDNILVDCNDEYQLSYSSKVGLTISKRK